VFRDKKGAIRLSKDSTFHARTKHIDVHFHFILQTVLQDKIQLEYIPTFDMIGDTFTKSLSFFKFTHFCSLLGLHWTGSSSRGSVEIAVKTVCYHLSNIT